MMAALATAAMTLGELFGSAAGDLSNVRIEDLVLDSREVQPGVAFVAVPGTQNHGLDYLDDALARGAAVVVYEPSAAHPKVAAPSIAVPGLKAQLGEFARAYFGREAEPVILAGVTGTNGKSTVAHLLAEAQTLRGTPCGYFGTLGYGVPPNLVAQTLTTADCLTLHRTLRSLAVSHAAMEVSSHALAQDRIAGLEFGTAVFTNLSRDHLDYHGDLDRYGEAKARLFRLPALHHAVLFADDPFSPVLAERLDAAVTRIDVSLQQDADIRGRLVNADLHGIKLEVRGPGGRGVITSSLVGDFNAENLLLALGALMAWEVPLADACDLLGRCSSLTGRMQVFGGDHGEPWVVVDYAHTPAALTRVLENLRRLSSAELWCVFGCGGQRDSGKRAAMGTAAARIAEHIVLTDDNPRDEDPGVIVADIRAGIAAHPDVWIEHDRRRAITDAVNRARTDDVVLVAGKGHEESQWVGGEQRKFSDRAVVEDALAGRG
jgi:UDP-N-acetylmuramoyl-L-alanyl-D-glutamate--2,6-diaminopimelate ligase